MLMAVMERKTQNLRDKGGTARNVSRLNLDATETVFNEDSVDTDFRVESDGATNALFIQGSDGKIGMWTDSPGSKPSNNGHHADVCSAVMPD